MEDDTSATTLQIDLAFLEEELLKFQKIVSELEVLGKKRSFNLHLLKTKYNFLPGYKTLYLGTKLHTCVQYFILGCKTSYLGTRLHSWVQNFIPGYKTLYLGTKLPIRLKTSYQVKNFISG
jgi:hypothetical protein